VEWKSHIWRSGHRRSQWLPKDHSAAADSKPGDEVSGDIINDLTKVSMTMASHLFSKQNFKEKNVVILPLALHTVLSIIAAGSEGPTQQELLDFLGSKSTEHLNSFASHLLSVVLKDASATCGPRLSFVNGVWVEQTLSLQPSFKQIVATDYKANLASVDFQNKVCISIVFFIYNCVTIRYFLKFLVV